MDRNKHSKIAVIALIIASVLSVFIAISIFPYLSGAPVIDILFYLLIPVAIMFNLFAAYKIHKGNRKFIKYVFWLYALQIIGFQTSEWAFSFLLGFSFHITWSLETVSLTINLFAILMSVLLFNANRAAVST